MAATITYEQKRRSKELLQMYLWHIGRRDMTNKDFYVLSGIPYAAIQEWTAGTKPLPPKWHDVMGAYVEYGS